MGIHGDPIGQRVADAIKNGIGTILARLIIYAFPFLLGAAAFAGNTIVQLTADKILSAIERLEKRMDNISRVVERNNASITELQVNQAISREVDRGQDIRINGLERKR